MKKRIFSGVIAAALLFSALPRQGYGEAAPSSGFPTQTQDGISWLAVTRTGYQVSMSQDVKTDVNQTVSVALFVSGNSRYNAYDLTLTYDTARLKFVSGKAADTGASVAERDGTVRVLGYGREKTAAETAVTLQFTAKAPGTAQVRVTKALIDGSGNAPTADAPQAALARGTVKIEIGGYPVTLDEGLTADLLVAEAGKDYTFRATDPLHYDYKPTVTVGGKTVSAKDNGDGTYTIPGDKITGAVTVKANRTAKTYRVTLQGTDLTGEKTAQYNTDYAFQLKRAAGYRYTLRVTIGGKSYTGYQQNASGYAIPGKDITGNIVIVAQKTKTTSGGTQGSQGSQGGQAQSKVSVSFIGSGAGDATGAATAARGKDYTFRLNQKEGATYSVSVRVGSTQVECKYDPAQGICTVPGSAVTGDMTVTVTKTLRLEINTYLTLDGAEMYLIVYSGPVENGMVPMYRGSNMYDCPAYGGYAWLVVSTDGEQTVWDSADVFLAAGTATARIDHSGDVDLNGRRDGSDARLAYETYNAEYTLTDMEMRKFLNADVNGDRKLDVKDAAWIVDRIVRGK